MENPVKNKELGIPQINVDYIDRRSGSAPPDHDFCRSITCENTNKENISEAENKPEEDLNHEDHNKLSRQTSLTPHMQDKLQRKLKFYFMNPIEKWKAKGRFPYKLSVQTIKLVVVTIQLIIFAQYISGHVTRQEDTKYSMRHVYLMNWESIRDLKTYPPAAGIYAVYSKSGFYDHINYAIGKYVAMEEDAIAPYSYDSENGNITSMTFCKAFYKVGKVWAFNDSFVFDSKELSDLMIIAECVAIPPESMKNKDFSIQKFLGKKNFTINFSRLKYAELKFNVKSIFLKSLKPWDLPDCYKFINTITYDNSNHDGLISVKLETVFDRRTCHGNIQYSDSNKEQTILDDLLVAVVITMCTTSFILCSRALYRAYLLQKETVTFFKRHLDKTLPVNDRTEFLNMWYVTIIVNDLLIIMGSIFKLLLAHYMLVDSKLYTTCTITLGIGNLLMWSGVLRYFGFFPKYNILILTLKSALPDVLRYMLCVLFLYTGYSVCGWLVLGPYHYKFRTFSRTSQCLFSLINGDDMFASFQMVSPDANATIHMFSQLYLYSFITLFIYVVLSLFIAVIMESYEVIKEYYNHGFPASMLMEFIAQCDETASSSMYKHDSTARRTRHNCFRCLCCRQDVTDESYEEIIGASDY
ncbi:Mucolipin-3 [Nymphon striatum]|nr:Mucolipin-3 [Nymphon striatum]